MKKYHRKSESPRYAKLLEIADQCPFIAGKDENSFEESALDMLKKGKTLIAMTPHMDHGNAHPGVHFVLRQHGSNICIYNPIDTFADNIVLSPEAVFRASEVGIGMLALLCDMYNWASFYVDEKGLLSNAITFPESNLANKIASATIPDGGMITYDKEGNLAQMMMMDSNQLKTAKLHYYSDMAH